MTVDELRAALATMPGHAEITTQAGTCGIGGAELVDNRPWAGDLTVNLD